MSHHFVVWLVVPRASRRRKTELAACKTLAIVDFSALAQVMPRLHDPVLSGELGEARAKPARSSFLDLTAKEAIGCHARDIRSRRGEPEDVSA